MPVFFGAWFFKGFHFAQCNSRVRSGCFFYGRAYCEAGATIAVKSARTPGLALGPEDNPDVGTFAQFALQLEVGVMLSDDMLDNRKAKPGTACLFGTALVNTVKPLEYPFLIDPCRLRNGTGYQSLYECTCSILPG